MEISSKYIESSINKILKLSPKEIFIYNYINKKEEKYEKTY